jgi:hypothetical protein
VPTIIAKLSAHNRALCTALVSPPRPGNSCSYADTFDVPLTTVVFQDDFRPERLVTVEDESRPFPASLRGNAKTAASQRWQRAVRQVVTLGSSEQRSQVIWPGRPDPRSRLPAGHR